MRFACDIHLASMTDDMWDVHRFRGRIRLIHRQKQPVHRKRVARQCVTVYPSREGNTPTAMVNRSFANLYFNGSAAIGRHLVQPANPQLATAEVSKLSARA